MARVEIAVRGLFATSVAAVEVPGAAGLHANQSVPACMAPALKFADEDRNSVGSAETIWPRPGLPMLFASWLYQQVRPNRGTGLRISIAFNLGMATTDA